MRFTGCRVTRLIALCLGPCLLGGTALRAEEAPTAAEPPEPEAAEEDEAVDVSELTNWVEVGVGGAFVDGDEARFMQRHRRPDSAFGGIEAFHYERGVGEEGLLKLDGRGLFDLHDYELRLDLTLPEKGYIRAGYREFRTWYDGSGGYLTIPAPSGTWISLYDDNLQVDRGEAWFEAGLTLPELPKVSFRYAHQFRDGKKDSTVWGDHSLDGSNFGLSQRGIVPSFWDLDETRDIFDLRAVHTVKATDLRLGLRYEMADLENSLYVNRRPGEPAADRFVTSNYGNEVDLFNVHGSTLTRFSEQVVFTTGAAFTTLENDLSGGRFYGAGYDQGYDLTTLGRRQAGDTGFENLGGGSRLHEYVLNLNLMYNPSENLALVPSVRVQKQDTEGTSTYVSTADTIGGTLAPVNSFANMDRELISVSERLDLRYTGVTNWVFYGRGEWIQDQGDLSENYSGRLAGAILPNPNFTARDTDHDRLTQKYTAGVNWYPLRRVNFAAQYYYKLRDNDYHHFNIVRPPTFLGSRYPGFITEQAFATHDVNFRVTLRPRNNLTLVSRYDFQYSTVDTRAEGLAELETAEVTSHIIGQNVTWAPVGQLYLQAGLNVAFDRTETPAQDLTGAQASLVPASQNDYWSGHLTAGYSVDEKTDVQATYFIYRANNFFDNSAVSVPYGADSEEHGVTVGLGRQMTPRVRWNLRYGFFAHREDASGGNNDYDAHLVYTSVHYRF